MNSDFNTLVSEVSELPIESKEIFLDKIQKSYDLQMRKEIIKDIAEGIEAYNTRNAIEGSADAIAKELFE